MKKRWEIAPFVGIGPLRFGMTPQRVAQLDAEIGQVTLVEKMYDFTIEHRSTYTPKCIYKGDRLNCVDTHENQKFNIFYNDTNVYDVGSLELMRFLETVNGGARLGDSSIFFSNIGINTNGFFSSNENRFYDPGSNEQDDRTLAVYDREAFNELMGMMRKSEPVTFF